MVKTVCDKVCVVPFHVGLIMFKKKKKTTQITHTILF